MSEKHGSAAVGLVLAAGGARPVSGAPPAFLYGRAQLVLSVSP